MAQSVTAVVEEGCRKPLHGVSAAFFDSQVSSDEASSERYWIRPIFSTSPWMLGLESNVALRPLGPYGLLGTGSQRPPPPLSHSCC